MGLKRSFMTNVSTCHPYRVEDADGTLFYKHIVPMGLKKPDLLPVFRMMRETILLNNASSCLKSNPSGLRSEWD